MQVFLCKNSQILKFRSYMMFVYSLYWSMFSESTGNVGVERFVFLELSVMDPAFCYVAGS
jgi:hypothetical protein